MSPFGDSSSSRAAMGKGSKSKPHVQTKQTLANRFKCLFCTNGASQELQGPRPLFFALSCSYPYTAPVLTFDVFLLPYSQRTRLSEMDLAKSIGSLP